jgi:1-deoxy-D-xylulose-5-phosphate reductoisomerase
VLNAANEVAVEAFLNRQIRFDQIHTVNAETLSRCVPTADVAHSVESLLDLDRQARVVASAVAAGRAS